MKKFMIRICICLLASTMIISCVPGFSMYANSLSDPVDFPNPDPGLDTGDDDISPGGYADDDYTEKNIEPTDPTGVVCGPEGSVEPDIGYETTKPTESEDNNYVKGNEKGISWRYYYSTNTLILSGEYMQDTAHEDVLKLSWAYYKDYAVNLEISEGIKNIGSYAFYNFKKLEKVTLPSSVTSIGKCAFANCYSLHDIALSEDNTSFKLDNGVLYNEDKTTLVLYPAGRDGREYTMPSGTEKIGDYAFFGSSLRTINVSEGVETLGEGAFYYCEDAFTINLPDSLDTIGDKAFFHCLKLDEINIPDNVTILPYAAFYRCESIKNISLSNSVIEIGEHCFDGCSGLGYFYIPTSVTSIGEYAFRNCTSIYQVEMPSSVTHIAPYTFAHCSRLTKIDINNTIGSSITSIAHHAYYDCGSLTYVTVPEKVTEIGEKAFGYDANDNVISDFVINGYSTSAAAKYAADNSINFYSLDETEPPTSQTPTTTETTEATTESVEPTTTENNPLESVSQPTNSDSTESTPNQGDNSESTTAVTDPTEGNTPSSPTESTPNQGDITEPTTAATDPTEGNTPSSPTESTPNQGDISESTTAITDPTESNTPSNPTESTPNQGDISEPTTAATDPTESSTPSDPTESNNTNTEPTSTTPTESEPLPQDSSSAPTTSATDKPTNPTVSGSDNSGGKTPNTTPTTAKKTQKITRVKSKYTKTYGAKKFSLNAKANGNGKLSYKSSNKKVVKVSKNGKVTIVGLGKATITITAAKTSKYKKATKKVTITVKPAKFDINLIKRSVKYEKGAYTANITLPIHNNADVYEYDVSLNSKFKTPYTISKYSKDETKPNILGIRNLKTRTYYIKAKAGKKINGKMNYVRKLVFKFIVSSKNGKIVTKIKEM